MQKSTTVTVPDRIARLPRDPRGYPIPWNVLRRTDGDPVFTVNDDRKHIEAIVKTLCPICGERLGRWKWFVGGPRSAFDAHGWYIDLPGHHECIRFALATCPYLALPRYLGRVDVPDLRNLPSPILIDDTMIPERPEVFVAVASDHVEFMPKPIPELPRVRPARPYLDYEFWRAGQMLPRAEGVAWARLVMGPEWMPPAPEEAARRG